MNIQKSQHRIITLFGWDIIEDTVQVIDEKNCIWVAQVETTHLHEDGYPEERFAVLVKGFSNTTWEIKDLAALGHWCLKQ